MITRPHILIIAAVLLTGAQFQLHAQLVADGATLNIKTSTNFAGDLTIGESFGNTTLNVDSPGAVTNLAGYIGFKESCNSNQVNLRNAGAIWRNYTTLDIGYEGAFNSLTISNGATVISDLSRIGNTVNSSNNSVTVAGPGSVWDSGPITVGDDGSQNSLFIRDGGTVSTLASSGFFIGRYDGSNNLVHVSNGNLTVGGTLVVHQGTLRMDDGSISASNLTVPSASGNVIFNGGTLTTHGGSISNFFLLGNEAGWPLATWEVRGDAPTTIGIDLRVGNQASSTTLLVRDGGVLENWNCQIGLFQESVDNVAIVDGPTSVWTNHNALTVGYRGRENALFIQNGGHVQCAFAIIGSFSSASNSLAHVRHPGSTWVIDGGLAVGDESPGNTLNITDGGSVWSDGSAIGARSGNNQAIVSGSGSTWTNSSGLEIGGFSLGSSNSLLIADGGIVASEGDVTIGAGSGNDNLLHVNGGILFVAGELQSGRGLLQLDVGTITASNLVAGGVPGSFLDFNGGTLSTSNASIHVQTFVVGNSSSPAHYQMLGNGLHFFSNKIIVANHAQLSGSGSIAGIGTGVLTVQSGGTLSPGSSLGQIVLSNSPVLQGNIIMEISRDSGNLTNDHIQVTGSLNYGGSLVVTDIGPDALVAGDTFQLFSATSYGGNFTGLTLPMPGPGLMWDNTLAIDGSLSVIPMPPPNITGVSRSDTGLIIQVAGGAPDGPYDLLTSTNLSLPISNWSTNSSGTFDVLGNGILTNGINPDEPERYYRISAP